MLIRDGWYSWISFIGSTGADTAAALDDALPEGDAPAVERVDTDPVDTADWSSSDLMLVFLTRGPGSDSCSAARSAMIGDCDDTLEYSMIDPDLLQMKSMLPKQYLTHSSTVGN